MASRQEEKERRRRERLERETAERAAVARRKRMQFAFGGLLAVLIVAGVVVLAAGALSGSSSGDVGRPSAAKAHAKIPAQQTADLQKAAAAAGCKLVNAPIEGRTHETKNFTEKDYKTNPPTSGNHNPVWPSRTTATTC
jgi:cytochrome c-type biogenesis protein CcmH/NrfG